MTKQEILDAIRQTAKENDGKPLGHARFEKETGIRSYDWGKHWSKFGDAQKEAGFAPNQMTSAYTNDFLFGKVIGLMRKLGKFPTYGELRLEKNNDPEFPSRKTIFETKEQKQKLAQKIIEWCDGKNQYDDIVEFCSPILEEVGKKEKSDNLDTLQIGEVYLCKSGRYYKIGKTMDFDRRISQIKMPHKSEEVHKIKTDDPSGVEAYWHRRFEAKRMQGEWFDLNSADIKAFKRWRRIV